MAALGLCASIPVGDDVGTELLFMKPRSYSLGMCGREASISIGIEFLGLPPEIVMHNKLAFCDNPSTCNVFHHQLGIVILQNMR